MTQFQVSNGITMLNNIAKEIDSLCMINHNFANVRIPHNQTS